MLLKSNTKIELSNSNICKSIYYIKLFFIFSLSCVLLTLSAENLNAQEFAQKVMLGIGANNPAVIQKSATISLDGNYMIFLSNLDGKWKFYESEKQASGQWSEPQSITGINDYSETDNTLHSPSLNADGTKLYFGGNYINDGGGMNIYVAEKIDGSWQNPVPLDAPINTPDHDGSPSITPDENTLYFVRRNTASENKDYNCRLIWVAHKNEKGFWNEPYLLPQPINLECEECPTIAPDGKTLYFSSVRKHKDALGRESKDGYDLYYARNISGRIWEHPVILDSMNTDGDEMYPSIGVDGDILYFNSGDEKKKNKEKWYGNIFLQNLPTQARPQKVMLLKGTIKDLYSEKPLSAKVSVIDPITSEVLSSYKTNPKDGSYQLSLVSGKIYTLDFSQEGYSHSILNYDLRKLHKNERAIQNASIYSSVNLLMNVYDNEVFAPLSAEINIRNQETGEIAKNTKVETLAQGRYKLSLPIGILYQFEFAVADYDTYQYTFDMREIVQFDEYEKDVELQIKKRPIEIWLQDSENQLPITSDVLVNNLLRRETFKLKATDAKEGKHTLSLREGDSYEITVNPSGYAFYNTTFNLKEDKSSQLKIKLDSIKQNKTLVLNNIIFEYNSADLEEQSYEELGRLVTFLTENGDVNVEISAHTDNVGPPEYNLVLSQKRAASVVTYLSELGIDANRLKSVGYGESMPLYPNNSEANKALNRRVEMKIIQIGNIPDEEEK